LVEEVLKGILKSIQAVFRLDRVLLGLVNCDSSVEEIKLALGVGHRFLRESRWECSDDEHFWQELRAATHPIILDHHGRTVLPSFLRQIFPSVFFKAPMVVKGELLGTVMGDREEAFSNKELELIQLFVGHAGIAVENGRLYYDVICSEEKLKEAQGQLVAAERLAVIGQLAVSINHEINNPLCAISLICQTLKKKLLQRAPELVDSLKTIEQNIQRICDVTRRISEIKNASSTEYLPDQLMINLK
jgi:signal transduction histidine kinase